jgi:hypothetical protein
MQYPLLCSASGMIDITAQCPSDSSFGRDWSRPWYGLKHSVYLHVEFCEWSCVCVCVCVCVFVCVRVREILIIGEGARC